VLSVAGDHSRAKEATAEAIAKAPYCGRASSSSGSDEEEGARAGESRHANYHGRYFSSYLMAWEQILRVITKIYEAMATEVPEIEIHIVVLWIPPDRP
jgi:hypothetical protein